MRPIGWAGRQLARLDRRPVPHRVIVRALPRAIRMRFDPGLADGLEAVFELAIRDPRGRDPQSFALTITGARCSVRPGAPDRPARRRGRL